MASVLGIEDGVGHAVDRSRLLARERGRIQIVSEIEAHRANRSLVSHPYADGMGNIVIVALACRGLLQAEPGFFWDQRARLWNMSCTLVNTFPASWKIVKLMLS